VLDAARAIESNNIGAVAVQDKGRVVGIVTDRDLTIRVVGQGLDPKTTLLKEVMTTPVATLSAADSQSDAIRLMQERNLRRIPLVEGERLVGMVTAASLRTPAMERRAARAEATLRRVLNQLRTNASLESVEEAATAFDIVLSSLVRRLTPGEAKDLIAQLPSLLQPNLYALPPGPDKLITRESIQTELVQRLDVDPSRAAQLLAIVGATVAQSVSAGQMKDVQGQLPEELRRIFSDQ
jgi:CBS-domain-containing membrane protein